MVAADIESLWLSKGDIKYLNILNIWFQPIMVSASVTTKFLEHNMKLFWPSW